MYRCTLSLSVGKENSGRCCFDPAERLGSEIYLPEIFGCQTVVLLAVVAACRTPTPTHEDGSRTVESESRGRSAYVVESPSPNHWISRAHILDMFRVRADAPLLFVRFCQRIARPRTITRNCLKVLCGVDPAYPDVGD